MYGLVSKASYSYVISLPNSSPPKPQICWLHDKTQASSTKGATKHKSHTFMSDFECMQHAHAPQ